jgi:hypothetical protein
MGHDHQPPRQQAQSDEPLFPVNKAIVFKRNARAVKQPFGILEAEAMLAKFFRFFASSHSYFIPFQGFYCNSFCSYKQGDADSHGRDKPGIRALPEVCSFRLSTVCRTVCSFLFCCSAAYQFLQLFGVAGALDRDL